MINYIHNPNMWLMRIQNLSKVGSLFGVAAAFGNVHGVYSPGNVELRPVILKNSQDYIEKRIENKTETRLFCFSWRQRITSSIKFAKQSVMVPSK